MIFIAVYCLITGRLLEFDATCEADLLDVTKDDKFDQISVASAASSLSPKFCTVVYDYHVRLRLSTVV